ncbi:peptidyl-tRNA hydrolase, PTH2 family [Apostasia shenzhenica]|uniref:peptidyl-tRNA hydrolase n=1 Tax=Apostasia shenzhenica TaxID=1088818 RepID=A0A2I0A1W9_9ASPA|nr:peptidyl-tRNA hydrolase, PTH2 family [Apostasia shenzhenica]
MGVSVSLLIGGTTAFFGTVCFAAGYLLSGNACRTINPDDDDGDNENGKKASIKGLRRLFSWAQAVVRGKAGVKGDANAVAVEGRNSKRKKPSLLEIESLAEILEDFKMVLVVRNDLKMGKGKIAAQCSHATLGLYKKLHNRAPKALNRWEMCGQVKVVLKIESEEDMLVLLDRAKSLKLPTHITVDAGRTQIAPNSRTVMAILGKLLVIFLYPLNFH